MKLDLIDVFGCQAMSGNPLGVVHGADDLDAQAMLALTQWIGFSETTLLLPPTDPTADYRVRIFYPGGGASCPSPATRLSARAMRGCMPAAFRNSRE